MSRPGSSPRSALPRSALPPVVFDGDDTLWVTEPLYDEARAHAARIVAAAGLDPLRFEALQRDIDAENVQAMGLAADRFPTSTVQAYRQLARVAGRAPDVEVEHRVYTAAAAVFDEPAPLVPSAREVLETLRPAHRIVLLTKGDDAVQRRRIEQSGLAPLFDRVVVVESKEAATFDRLLRELEAASHSAWSVGNSLPSDIAPALDIGMRAIWIDAYVWAHERRQHDVDLVHPSLRIARNLADVPEILHAAALEPAP